MPFKEENSIKIIEFKNASEYFLDQDKPKKKWASYGIYSPYADTVRCIRKGLVVKIIDKYIDDGAKKKFTPKKNIIIVEHKDGTYASYKGFAKGTIKVKLGQTVYPHTELGVIGNANDKYALNFQSSYFNSKYLSLKIKKDNK